MTPDLGKYAFYVLGSYGISLLLIAGLVALSVIRSRKVKAELDTIEARTGRHGA